MQYPIRHSQYVKPVRERGQIQLQFSRIPFFAPHTQARKIAQFQSVETGIHACESALHLAPRGIGREKEPDSEGFHPFVAGCHGVCDIALTLLEALCKTFLRGVETGACAEFLGNRFTDVPCSGKALALESISLEIAPAAAVREYESGLRGVLLRPQVGGSEKKRGKSPRETQNM